MRQDQIVKMQQIEDVIQEKSKEDSRQLMSIANFNKKLLKKNEKLKSEISNLESELQSCHSQI